MYLDSNNNEIEAYDLVSMPEPNETDLHNNEFEGFVVDFRGNNIVVEDSDGDCFEIEPERVAIVY